MVSNAAGILPYLGVFQTHEKGAVTITNFVTEFFEKSLDA
jgi:hypothetical protein